MAQLLATDDTDSIYLTGDPHPIALRRRNPLAPWWVAIICAAGLLLLCIICFATLTARGLHDQAAVWRAASATLGSITFSLAVGAAIVANVTRIYRRTSRQATRDQQWRDRVDTTLTMIGTELAERLEVDRGLVASQQAANVVLQRVLARMDGVGAVAVEVAALRDAVGRLDAQVRDVRGRLAGMERPPPTPQPKSNTVATDAVPDAYLDDAAELFELGRKIERERRGDDEPP